MHCLQQVAWEFPDFLIGVCISVHCHHTSGGTNRVLAAANVGCKIAEYQIV